MNNFAKFIKNINFSLFIPAIILSLMGLIMIWGISRPDFTSVYRQATYFIIALAAGLLLSSFNLKFLKSNSYLILTLYFLALISLVGLLVFGSTLRGVKGWYQLGAVSVSPTPFAAVFLIVILSKYFSSRSREMGRFAPISFSALYFLPFFALILIQPDLGSALALVSAWAGVIMFSGLKFRHFVFLFLIFLIILGLGWQFWLRDYQKERILAFANPQSDPQGVAWNTIQSKIAIGSGGLLGKGIGQGSQTQYGFLPEVKTDFIFSGLAEETGFAGVFVLIFLYLFIFCGALRVSFYSYDNFTRLYSAGFAFMLFSQFIINTGMCLGLLPVIGIPLPFVSYGGSHLLAYYMGLGILGGLTKK